MAAQERSYPKVSSKELYKTAKVLLSELVASMRTYDYSPTPKEAETVSICTATSAVGSPIVLAGGGYGTYRFLNIWRPMRDARRARVALSLGCGLYFYYKFTTAVTCATVAAITMLDSPMGREMAALIQEGEFKPEQKQALLMYRSMKLNGKELATHPRVRPIDSPFTQTMIGNEEAWQDRASSGADSLSSGSSWDRQDGPAYRQDSISIGEGFSEDRQAGGTDRSVGTKSGAEYRTSGQQDAGQQGASNDGNDDYIGTEIFGSQEYDPNSQQGNNVGPRKSRSRERREARRRQLGVSNQAEPEDAMSDYFDKRWEGKDT